ncbi:MAG: SAM-dependent chlorinase/fluorinase [Burkholderiales bacterium]|nr:SAM-dependent chlorinase/fluorinase [Burkholderiales bacterium]
MAIVLFTDFGSGDIYVGQVKAVLQRLAPGVAVIDLLHDVPAFNVRAGAHLLAAMVDNFPEDSVFLAVVDPGVGGARDAVVVRADERWYVGPDNGLLSVVAARARNSDSRRISWQPPELSASFHGRDLFAPVAARLAAQGGVPADWLEHTNRLNVDFGGDDLPEIIYVDHYGNAQTAVRASGIARTASLLVGAHRLPYARVFSEAAEGAAFWYGNSQGLVEIAVNRGSAARLLGLKIGEPLVWA